MLNLYNYFFNQTDKLNFDAWLKWQQSQSTLHFIDSNLSSYIHFKPGYKNIYIRYCFGDFENIYILPENCQTELTYITLLLSTYDKCKGYGRTIKGDTNGIYLLREVIKSKNLDELYYHDFKQYFYDYGKIHAHTVAYFSLSTLIMFFLSNYMHYKSYNSDNFPHIDMALCKNVYNKKVYGDITYVVSHKDIVKSNNIDIKPKDIVKDVKPFNSWPMNNVTIDTTKCSNCKRACDKTWGKLKVCLDCHLYQVCFICGGQKIIIHDDNYPRCILHKNVEN